ncbi:hypothetical protein C8R44DRAFT_892502 [Mycena epipterygia]|nr:hypothetical protein C8R44DRAFT_892502 [Mycena epipterygia]
MQALYPTLPTGVEADWHKRIAPRGYQAEAGTSSAKSTSGGSNLRAVPQQAGLGDLSEEDGDGIRSPKKANDDEALGPSSRVLAAPKKKAVIKSEAARRKLEPQSSVTIVSTPNPAPVPAAILAVVAAAWDNTWIPTLLHLLRSRENPWDITDEEIEDAFAVSQDRLNNGRSWFPTQAFMFVSKHFLEAFPDTTPKEKKALISTPLVNDYLDNANKFSQRKWEVILNLCGAAVNIAPPGDDSDSPARPPYLRFFEPIGPSAPSFIPLCYSSSFAFGPACLDSLFRALLRATRRLSLLAPVPQHKLHRALYPK